MAFVERGRTEIFCLNAISSDFDLRDGQVVVHINADNMGEVLPGIEILWQLKALRKNFQGKNAVESDGT